jgi:hypothetical protein
MFFAIFHCVLELILSIKWSMLNAMIFEQFVSLESLHKVVNCWAEVFKVKELVGGVPGSSFQVCNSFNDNEAADINVHGFISATEPLGTIHLFNKHRFNFDESIFTYGKLFLILELVERTLEEWAKYKFVELLSE